MYELMGNLSLPVPLTALTSIYLGGRAACIEEAGFRSKKRSAQAATAERGVSVIPLGSKLIRYWCILGCKGHRYGLVGWSKLG